MRKNDGLSNSQRYRLAHPGADREYAQSIKLDVLAHYGPAGQLRCSWPDCQVIDPDS
jgi:hypothetical protein